MENKKTYLSYILDERTPTYGNRSRFVATKQSSIEKGDVANDSKIETTVHIGTHLDMPYHFYENGQTIEDFDVDFFDFKNVLFLSFEPQETVIGDELIEKLETAENKSAYDMLVVKTGICHLRDEDVFWEKNFGFHPKIAEHLRKHFPNIRVFGFDSISVSSFADRMPGREAHRAFLDPSSPILLLEDMDLRTMDKSKTIASLTVVPLRIARCDGLPCTVIAKID